MKGSKRPAEQGPQRFARALASARARRSDDRLWVDKYAPNSSVSRITHALDAAASILIDKEELVVDRKKVQQFREWLLSHLYQVMKVTRFSKYNTRTPSHTHTALARHAHRRCSRCLGSDSLRLRPCRMREEHDDQMRSTRAWSISAGVESAGGSSTRRSRWRMAGRSCRRARAVAERSCAATGPSCCWCEAGDARRTTGDEPSTTACHHAALLS